MKADIREKIMIKTTVISAAIALAAITACSSGGSQASPAACKTAMTGQLAQAIASGKKGTEPAACTGLSNAELRKLAGQVIGGALGSALGGNTTAPVAGNNTAACKIYVAAFNKFRHYTGDSTTAGAAFDAQLAVADSEAAGKVKTDLDATQAGMTELLGGGSSDDLVRPAERAFKDCFALGIG